MTDQPDSSGIEGWGVYLPGLVTLPGMSLVFSLVSILTHFTLVVNKAVGGRSARSFRREGKWAAVLALLKAGDYVIVEFGESYNYSCVLNVLLTVPNAGHNDGGSPSTSDRAPVSGEGTNTQTVTLADGTVEVVQTFST